MSDPFPGKKMKILSLGAGVQSSTVLLMSCRGDLPKLDAAIFADTQWEPEGVYGTLEWLKEEAEQAGIPVHVVTAGDLRKDALRSVTGGKKHGGERWASLPLFTLSKDGAKGMIRRQCTSEYKIQPITKKIRELLGYKPRQRIPVGSVQQWFGISRDEIPRMRESRIKWITNYYPLIEGPESFTRQDCLNWLRAHYDHTPQRSACIGCPFRDQSSWREIRSVPDEWDEAVAFDKSIRNMEGMGSQAFIHRDCVPLDEVDLSSLEDKGQMNWLNECEGMCGV
jgi:hypothetical protein